MPYAIPLHQNFQFTAREDETIVRYYHLRWAMGSEGCSELLNGCLCCCRIHTVDIQPLGMSIDYEEEHLPNKRTCIINV